MLRLRNIMQLHQKNEIKVKVATRQQALPNDVTLVGGVLLLVILSVVVLIGRPAGCLLYTSPSPRD